MLQTITSPFLYADVLLAQSEGMAKGERTRARIMKSTSEILNETGPLDLRVTDVCERAGISNGTFYIYFTDRVGLLEDLLTGFVGFLQDSMREASRQEPEGPIRAATEAYYELFRLNRGMMRCLIHHMDSFPGAKQVFHTLNAAWVEAVVSSVRMRLKRDGSEGAVAPDELTRRAYALGGMVDQYLSSLFLSEDPGLIAVSGDREAVLDTLTLIWTRGMAK
ncbi:TetR/AcrR family transcriptional regulator [Hwanghaeella grinnelliae]|uniref:TetR/AcrR family transcriptional regulator n=1 Tax=Hwanghaeella grinnelliae TaxID=2500179 RepID=A0A3S3USL4_9PROT|nr:TetR/AcrR family transcriptional regulator [Hwanghaeella grinnelliae]RVU39596.1 TetR/AcrR family transcriptional regulator [Hwanghaeella grinnelliae]